MSEYSYESPSPEGASEFHSGGVASAECSAAQSVPMPFDADSREADALRGAISFLFSLITVYDELTQAALEGDPAGDEESRRH